MCLVLLHSKCQKKVTNQLARALQNIAEAQASDLFLAFDTDGSGGIDEKEFMKALFPLDYRRMYRRASGVTFGA